MPARKYEEQGLLTRSRSWSGSRSSSEEVYLELDDVARSYSPIVSHTSHWWPRRRRSRTPPQHRHVFRVKRRRSLLLHCCHTLVFLPYILFALILIAGVFFPSYSNPPIRYSQYRTRLSRLASHGITGGGNLQNEKVFIAASLYDRNGTLLSGHWGHSVRRLVEMLGPQNVFISVYENDPDERSIAAMEAFEQSLRWKSLQPKTAIVHEVFDGSDLPKAVLPDGSRRTKRLPFLAEVRNRALRPLEDETSSAYHTRWDKILYLNDVAFDPIDAVSLLFNTNVDEQTGKASYRAACAVDFINPFKFYDTFATRDTEGYDMGVPFYPWFSNAGNATSRRDVLLQTDAVRVKSCWGGMVAFDAKWFQPRLYDVVDNDLVPKNDGLDRPNPSSRLSTEGYQSPSGDDFAKKFTLHTTPPQQASSSSANSSIPPLRFRAETDTYWGASECCLIHADLAHAPYPPTQPLPSSAHANEDTGIYLNPYVRVAYSPSTLFWLNFTKRFERLYPLVHSLVNIIGRRPSFNPRQFEEPGQEVVDRIWRWDQQSQSAIENGSVSDLPDGLSGSFADVHRIAKPGMFCGGRRALYMKEKGDGEGHWGWLDVPAEG